MRLSLPLGLSDFPIRSNICLTLAVWMIHGPLGFRSLHPSLLRTGHCLGVGSLPFSWPMFPFVLRPWAGWCFFYAIALLLLWYHLSFYLLLPLGLQVEAPAISISYIIPSFGLYYPTFLLGQPISCLGLPRPISFFGHPRPISFFLNSFTPMGFFLLNPLGFPGIVTTSLPFGLIGLCANPIFTISFLGLPRSICFLSGHLLFCGPVDHYSVILA